ncbi:MAG: hypothetical protein JWQ97_2246 [Phenylobacterium sp.]|nr:hypothetical protein [Phenylobacterium sp.]
MRFMILVKASPESEAGAMPASEMIEAMDRYNDQLIAAGVMLDGGGLQPSSKGARVSFGSGKPLVTDGPFTETKELLGGYWIWQCRDLAEAVAWLEKAPFQEGTLEIRPFFEPEAFEGIASEEIIEKEKGWREEQARRAPTA